MSDMDQVKLAAKHLEETKSHVERMAFFLYELRRIASALEALNPNKPKGN